MLADLAIFLGVAALVIVTPGQDTALTVRNTLAGGRSSGIATAAGVACGQALWTLAASLGVTALVLVWEPAFLALKLAGAAYLIFLGLQSLAGALRGRPHGVDGGPRDEPARSAARQGLLSNLANPKMGVFFTSLLPQFAGTQQAFLTMLALGLIFCSMTFAWLSLYAAAVHRLRAFFTAGRGRRALDAVLGTVLVALGLRLASQRP
jgi:threonine/homoserine/homoserine lactone efflux protein